MAAPTAAFSLARACLAPLPHTGRGSALCAAGDRGVLPAPRIAAPPSGRHGGTSSWAGELDRPEPGEPISALQGHGDRSCPARRCCGGAAPALRAGGFAHSPVRVTWTSRWTAAGDGRLLAAVRALRQ